MLPSRPHALPCLDSYVIRNKRLGPPRRRPGLEEGASNFPEAEKESDDKLSRLKQKRTESEKLPFNSRSPAYLEYLDYHTHYMAIICVPAQEAR